MASLGEYLFYGSEKVKDSIEDEVWQMSPQTISSLYAILKNPNEDEIVKHYCIKTIENITCQSKKGDSGEKFCTIEFAHSILNICVNSQQQTLRASSLITLCGISLLEPKFIKLVVSTLGIPSLVMQVTDSEKKTQQAIMNLLCLTMLYGDTKDILTHFKTIYPVFLSFFEQGSSVLKAKTLMVFTILYTTDPFLLISSTHNKIVYILDRISLDKNKHLKSVLKVVVSLMGSQLDRGLDLVDKEGDMLSRSPRDDDCENDNQMNPTERLGKALLLISRTITSIHVQDIIMGEDRLIRIFQLARFYEFFILRNSSNELEIVETVPLIFEQIISNKKLIGKYQLLFAADILPPLCQVLDTRTEEARFAALKWIADIIIQISHEEVLPQTKELIGELSKRFIFSKSNSLISTANPIGFGIIKLLRNLLELDQGLTEYIFTFEIHKSILECFESRLI